MHLCQFCGKYGNDHTLKGVTSVGKVRRSWHVFYCGDGKCLVEAKKIILKILGNGTQIEKQKNI